MRIGIDVDSGERPFEELVEGALTSLSTYQDITIYLIGKSDRIRVSFHDIEKGGRVFLVDAREIVYMDESPIIALKKKKDSTVSIGCRMVKDGAIDVFFSAGNTGATVVSSVITLGMISGIKKPAMVAFFPRLNGGETIILDIGANPDATEESIYHNAILGMAYYSLIWNIKTPSIGLLNVGSEFGKGSKNIKKAFSHLTKIKSFVGNIEGYNVLNGSTDVVVCDGFTGNTILKFAEAMKDMFIHILKDSFDGEDSGKGIFTSKLKLFKSKSDKKSKILEKIMPKYFGAAPLLGVKGSILVGHGMCNSNDVQNAVSLAYFLNKSGYNEFMSTFVSEHIKK